MSKILSFDTSNYTTSACIFDTDVGVIWQERIMLSVKEGECGLRQNDAVFLHIKNLRKLFASCANDVSQDIDYIAFSNCPSEKKDSYMPCFMVGESFASAISDILHKPLYFCSHQRNHIAAALFSSDTSFLIGQPFIAYHVSGGTTDICLCLPTEEKAFSAEKIGGTLDISCGQLIDRTGVLLGLNFPCGVHIEKMASHDLKGNVKIKGKDGFYNFSGFQNQVEKKFKSGESSGDIATYVLDVVYSYIISSISFFRNKYGNIPIVMSGGVMSNQIISKAVSSSINDVYFSDSKYSSDNAVGTAYLCAIESGMINVK